MSGVVAIISKDATRPVTKAEIESLAHDYAALRGNSGGRLERNAHAARAIQFTSSADDKRDGSPSWLLVDGNMYNVNGSAGSFREMIAGADGQFVTIGYDAPSQGVFIANDPFGMYALYLFDTSSRVYVATSALALARHLKPPVDAVGLKDFLVSGYHFGTRTHWQGIRRLDPGTMITVEASSVTEEAYWRPEVDRASWAMSFRDSVDSAIAIGKETYSRYYSAGPPKWADLTGGYDSRLMCLLLERAGVHFKANTRTVIRPDDVSISRRVAASRDWEWCNPELPGDWPQRLPTMLSMALAWGDSQLEVLQLARVLWAHEQLARTRPLLFSAGGGEHFQYYAWQSEFLKAGRSSRVHIDRWIDMIAIKPAAVSVLAEGSVAEVRDDFRGRFARWIEPYADELNTTQLEMLYLYKCTGHFGAYRSADGGVISAELPFYLKPVFSKAFSTRSRYRNSHRLMRGMIHQLDPEVAKIVTTRGGPALPWRPWRAHKFLPYYRVVGRKAINKFSAAASGSPLLPSHNRFPWQRAANESVLAHLGSDKVLDWAQMRTASVLDRQHFQRIIHEATSQDFAETSMLGRIITAELALRETDTVLM